ncbi:MAG: ABC-F family ATP-binding cassette domain-containing protein [Candidatus Omnitrophica bacterium]|nr:ABC-F family ATP-binding cassette domain-containing protein [Candidatus Omnitrophota bacterium]
MITIIHLSKNFDERMLLEDVSLSIFPHERIGLTGPNGAGKSTLFQIILGQMEPSTGSVQIQKNLKIGYMAQEARYTSDRSIMDEMTCGDEEIKKLVDEKHKLEDEHKADSSRYGDIVDLLEKKGIYELEHKAEKILTGLGFKEEDFHQPIAQLSGGWQMRTQLAKLLTYQYDLLLLDEPTNYLDLEATLWLKEYLSKYDGTFITISHDKIFLNDVTNYTIILEDAAMTKVKGNYEAYEEAKAVRLRTLVKQQKVIGQKRQQLERFTERFHAQPNRASAVRNKRKMLERLEEIPIPPEKHSIGDFEFPPTLASGYTVLTMSKICKSYGEKKVYKDLDLEITRGQKICLVGPNGAGKSTLLKMIAGVLPFDAGTYKLGHQVQSGYFSQTRLEVLNPTRSVLEELLSASDKSIAQAQARTLLGVFNFRGDDVFKPVRVLSGGEKSRLILAKLLINPPNFILLDEPTTHLDIDGVEALTDCFKKYQGTLCFISHDLFFVNEIASHIVEVNNGHLKHYHGGLDYYLEKKAGIDADIKGQPPRAAQKATGTLEQPLKPTKKEPHSPHLQKAYQQHQQALKRLEEIKKETKALEEEQKQLETESYVKSRFLSDAFGRDPHLIKDYGIRLKEIQRRFREIAVTLDRLHQEKINITK